MSDANYGIEALGERWGGELNLTQLLRDAVRAAQAHSGDEYDKSQLEIIRTLALVSIAKSLDGMIKHGLPIEKGR